jgi:hypothetical protein
MKKLVLAVLGLGALVLNPFYACGGGPNFRYGALEMRKAIEGTWQITAPASASGPARQLTVSLRQGSKARQARAERSLIAPAAACGTRSLVRDASACTDDSVMPLEVRWGDPGATSGDTGELSVHGLNGEWGESILALDGAAHVTARISPEGVATDVQVDGHPATMARLATAQPATPR